MRRLIRLRADPNLLRVSVRRAEPRWSVFISDRETGFCFVTAQDDYLVAAIEKALVTAESLGVTGIDLDMEHAYEHPQWREESDDERVEH